MKGKRIWFGICLVAVWAIAVGWTLSARGDSHDAGHDDSVHYHGVINDYPVSTNSAGATTGPWELRGPWSLDLHPHHGTADFSAALTMEFSDLAAGSGATTDARHQHTHQITMNGATLIDNPPAGDCPASAAGTTAYTAEIEVTGMADVSGNGAYAFGAGVLVPLQVCLGGNSDVAISNMTMVFTNLPNGGGPSLATYHFGAQPIHGVVRHSH
jgi:hypothetical protein